jgi:molecular chaperone GrpE
VAGAPAGAGPELAELRDRHLRLLADFDNFRKRAERELEERTRYVLAEPIRDLLPVLDNLERALAAQGSEGDLIRGVEMIARQFLDVLRRFGVEPVPAVGARFDPRRHEAVMSVESAAVAEPTVVEELQRGYLLRDRLLRPALVKVAVPAEGAGPQAPDAGVAE